MATSGIDFATLSTQDALDLAILIEEEAEERYREFAHHMEVHHTPDAGRSSSSWRTPRRAIARPSPSGARSSTATRVVA